MSEAHTIALKGCAPVPLAHYLKALGILKLVSEQADPNAKGYWGGDCFYLVSTLSAEDLTDFFSSRYCPSPVIAPWNGGSGFFPKDNSAALTTILNTDDPRFTSYRLTIQAAQQILRDLGVESKLEDKNIKAALLEACRAGLPADSLAWFDAAVTLTAEGAQYPPLLGTGGNDGRLEFTNNFMQRIVEVLLPDSPMEQKTALLQIEAALFATQHNALRNSPIGQFQPGAAGGANAVSGFGSQPQMNPWDYILMLEGAIMFAASSVKKLESPEAGALSFPFGVRQVGAGYASAAAGETDSRHEIWLPLWENPASYYELRALMSEGRSQVGRRRARTAVDFARAIASYGVDRGVGAFQRYGFLVRNGLAYFATPLGRFAVKRQPQVDLLHEIDGWLDGLRGKAYAKTAPASVASAVRTLEEAILHLTQSSGADRMQQVLIALGNCEQALGNSLKWTNESFVQPVPPLSERWFHQCNDGTIEFRLAASLAGLTGPGIGPIRNYLEPVITWPKKSGGLGVRFDEQKDRKVLWREGHVIGSLAAVLQRRLVDARRQGIGSYADYSPFRASRSDIEAFIEGRVNERRFAQLLWGLILLDWPLIKFPAEVEVQSSEGSILAYALLKLCHSPYEIEGIRVPSVPEIARLAAARNFDGAMNSAVRRLRGSGLPVLTEQAEIPWHLSQRLVGALIFPVSQWETNGLARQVILQSSTN